MKTTPHYAPKLLAIVISVISTGSVYAGGVFVDTQNGAGTGNAFAGSAAVADDASTVYFNPAGMSRLTKKHSLSAAVSAIQAQTTFNNQGSTPIAPIVPLGEDSSDIDSNGVTPAFYYAQKVSPTLQLGLGVSPTYGSEGTWDDKFIGRYQGLKTEIVGVNINPSIAWMINDTLSIGAGLDYLKVDATISKKSPLVAGTSYIKDVENTVEGDDSGLGYNVGLLAQLTPATRLGLTYRSAIKLDLTGEATIAPELASVIKSFPSNVSVKMPDSASLAIVHVVNDDWEILGDVTWSGWSSIPAIIVENQNNGTTPIIETLNLEDNWRVGIGANYRLNTVWRLRTGVAWDQGVVPDAASRSVRMPDNDRTWLALGANYRLSDNTTVDMAYAHVFVKDGDVDRQTTTLYDQPTAQYLRGMYESKADILSLQVNYNFD
jgi:long-chain fatty acid transport protein